MSRPRRKRRGRLVAPLATAVLGASLIAASGVANADLQSRIDAAKSEAQGLESRIQARGDRISTLESQAADAQARIQSLSGELASGEQRSADLSNQLGTAESDLTAARARLGRAQGVLAARLVDIYKNGEVSYVDLVLSSNGFDDLSSRAGYLHAIETADARTADRVRSLNDQVKAEVDRITSLRSEIDDHNRQLVDARATVDQTRAGLKQQAGELASAKTQESSDLADIRSKISDLQSQLGSAQLGALFGNGHWAIPEYIVMCESGGNYHAVNASSGAGGAYQIMPATWRAHGGQGLPQNAPPAEQDRIAALIWADSGPGAWSCA
ncbi:MAG: resuscitation-promoting factor RpfA [Solirubrobacterales bacterium]|nr:resuscitation-promoting factor RpfA [Solirubrobacterales bacterium]